MMKKNKRVFVLQPFSPQFDAAYKMIQAASQTAGVETWRLDQVAVAGSITEQLYAAIEQSDLIVCDITHSNPNVMNELGYAHALREPVILISQRSEHMPFDVRSVRTLFYDAELGRSMEFVRNLETLIQQALQNPDQFSSRPRTETAVNTVFVSYSHKDAAFLDRLRVHLRPLEKQGLMDIWDDTKIEAGDQWKAAIEEALRRDPCRDPAGECGLPSLRIHCRQRVAPTSGKGGS
jgi:nucleoside 2-deoxyribosyltransferase